MTFTQEASFTRKWFSGRSCIRSNWKFRNVDIWGEGKTREKASWSRAKKQHTTQPIYGHKYGIDPGSHQWEAEAITSVPSLLPINSSCLISNLYCPERRHFIAIAWLSHCTQFLCLKSDICAVSVVLLSIVIAFTDKEKACLNKLSQELILTVFWSKWEEKKVYFQK